MDALFKIEELVKTVMDNLVIEKMPKITTNSIKKLFKKLSDKDLKSIVAGFNEAVANNNLSYYSQTIDNNEIFLYYDNGELKGAVTQLSGNKITRKSDCHFCHCLGRDVKNITIVERGKQGQYTSRMVSCCDDYKQCNDVILSLDSLNDFLTSRRNENERNTNSNQFGN